MLRPYVAAIDLLVADVPVADRDRGRGELLKCVLERVYVATGSQTPGWLLAMRDQLECADEADDTLTSANPHHSDPAR